MCYWSDRTNILGKPNIKKGDFSRPKKVKDMYFPRSKQELQRCLGMIAYLNKFIPKLSEQTHHLRELVKKYSICDFTLIHRYQFDKIRLVVNENISLEFFNPKWLTNITCDSSKFGIGATLKQKHENDWYQSSLYTVVI